jgi:phosphoglycerate dehydrogenase-like enzyme
MRIAILDDYQNVALEVADCSSLAGRATLTVFNDHVSDTNEIVERLAPFDVVCVMRERTPLSRDILSRLPRLKLIASTGPRNASIDVNAAKDRNIDVMHTRYESSPTIELTWALILASARNLIVETASVRSGGWQRTVGDGIRGKVLGILGLGNIGSEVARIGRAFGMDAIRIHHGDHRRSWNGCTGSLGGAGEASPQQRGSKRRGACNPIRRFDVAAAILNSEGRRNG